MLGDMLHSSVGVAANLHLATLGNFVSYDLTDPSRIKNDRFVGIKKQGQKFYVPQTEGLGIVLKKKTAAS
jgi:L-alanine-DL-glutamate epimerase-like enolase superfamily enzyme